jgi:hypothetical protein
VSNLGDGETADLEQPAVQRAFLLPGATEDGDIDRIRHVRIREERHDLTEERLVIGFDDHGVHGFEPPVDASPLSRGAERPSTIPASYTRSPLGVSKRLVARRSALPARQTAPGPSGTSAIE